MAKTNNKAILGQLRDRYSRIMEEMPDNLLEDLGRREFLGDVQKRVGRERILRELKRRKQFNLKKPKIGVIQSI